jgi:hypothetical protein
LGFMSSLPQLAWDKRLWCCCIEYSSVALHVKSNNNKNRPFGDIRKKITKINCEQNLTFIWGKSALSAALDMRMNDEQICNLACRELFDGSSCYMKWQKNGIKNI